MEKFLEDLIRLGQTLSFGQNQYILREGQKGNEVFYMIEGIVRHYVIDLNGREKTIRISRENEFFYSSIISYFTNEPTYINCQTLTPVRVISWTKDQLDSITSENREYELFRYKQLTLFIIEKHKKELSLLTQTAEQRYHEFCIEYSELFNRIPHHIIASYLNMTPETLSRIRKKSIS